MAIERLETESLVLRKPIPADWEPFRAFTMSERSQYIRDELPDLGKAWRMFATEFGHWDIHGFGMFTVTAKGDDTTLGMVGPWYPADWPETEIGWLMFEGAEGKGFAFEAAQAAISYAWQDLGWTEMVSYIDPANERSYRLAERLGAVRDPDAKRVDPDDLVYRHPKPENLS
ncbi:MAG: GNAT family N-acetyltransferase [Pseudomonadota bacterium]